MKPPSPNLASGSCRPSSVLYIEYHVSSPASVGKTVCPVLPKEMRHLHITIHISHISHMLLCAASQGHWERRIVELGGPDYAKTAPKITDSEGNEVQDSRGPGYR